MSQVQVVASTEVIHIVLDIPLQEQDLYMEVFQVKVVPETQEGMGRGVVVKKDADRILISQTRENYALLSRTDLYAGPLG
jgi:hypothetical protein